MTESLVSIIVLNWNGKDLLKNCLNSINKNTAYTNFEVIIVDNGSSDGSQEFVKENFPEFRLIENSDNLGFPIANNQGIKSSKGDYFLLLNNDTEVTKNWLTYLINVAESNPDIGIVGCKLVFPDGETQYAGGYITDAGIGKHILNSGTKEIEVEYVTGAMLLVKKKVTDKIGLLDEKFSPIYFEDTDLCFRARKAGYKVIYTPQSIVVHHESRTTKEKKWKYFVMNKNRIRFMLLNFPKTRLLKAVPWEILRIVKNTFKLRIHLLIKAYLVNIRDMQDIIEKRRSR